MEKMEKTEKTIKIACKAADLLALEAVTPFQGNLKKRTAKDIDRICRSMLAFGFSFPFFIWKCGNYNYCLDGHGRIAGLNELKQQGYTLPLFPAAYIDAADEQEAKQKLLRENSRYGLMTRESIAEFAGDITVDYDDLSIPAEDINFEGDVFTEAGEASPQNTKLNVIRFLEYVIYLSGDESGRLEAVLKQYIEETGSPEGFVSRLLIVKQ